MSFISKCIPYKPSAITIYNEERQAVVQEPSLVAFDTRTGKIIAMGAAVRAAAGFSTTVAVCSPLKHGAVANFEFSRSLLLFLLNKAGRPRYWLRPKAALFVPLEVTQIEYKVYTELLECIGARSGVLIVESTFKKLAITCRLRIK